MHNIKKLFRRFHIPIYDENCILLKILLYFQTLYVFTYSVFIEIRHPDQFPYFTIPFEAFTIFTLCFGIFALYRGNFLYNLIMGILEAFFWGYIAYNGIYYIDQYPIAGFSFMFFTTTLYIIYDLIGFYNTHHNKKGKQ